MNRQLPIGIHDFETIRTENYLYVDKTQLIYQLITKGRMYSLSRPRRFGKSLLISTLRAIFSGKRHLFQDLWIDKSDYTWQQHPVIWLDMATVNSSSPELLEQSLTKKLDTIAGQYGIQLSSSLSASDRLGELITQLSEDNQKVALLVDDYDKPLIDQAHHPEIAVKNYEILKHFYAVLRSQGTNIHFLLLTGVSKISMESNFSKLNNLEDISFLDNYATLLGYTHEELTDYFTSEIVSLAQKEGLSHQASLDKIKYWYNGYRFSKKKIPVHNPFSILSLLKQQDYSVYGFAIGTPAFLVNLIQQRPYKFTDIQDFKIVASSFIAYEVDQLSLMPLLYQIGYLTIYFYNSEFDYYTLGCPNKEAEIALSELLEAEK